MVSATPPILNRGVYPPKDRLTLGPVMAIIRSNVANVTDGSMRFFRSDREGACLHHAFS